jgi:hypothetical protein
MSGVRAPHAAAVAVLALLAAAVSWQASARTSAALGDTRLRSGFAWFGEPLRVQRFVEHQLDDELLSIETPLEPLIVRAPVRAWLRVMPGGDPLSVLRAFTAASAGLWAALLFVALSFVGCRLIDAVLFTLIGMASAAAQSWFAVPASMTIASVSSLVAVMVVARAGAQHPREWQTTIAVASSLSVTLANGVFGVAAAGVMHGRRRGFQVIVNGICIVLLLWPVQRTLYPLSGPPVDFTPDAPARIATAVVDAAIAPVHAIAITDRGAIFTGGAGYTWIGLIGVFTWLALLAIAVPVIANGHRRLGLFLSTVVIARLFAGLATEDSAFHASLDILPLLLIAAAMATHATHRRTVRVLALVLLAAMLMNQRMALDSAIAMLGGPR